MIKVTSLVIKRILTCINKSNEHITIQGWNWVGSSWPCFCPVQAGLTRFIKYPGLTWILYWITCTDHGIFTWSNHTWWWWNCISWFSCRYFEVGYCWWMYLGNRAWKQFWAVFDPSNNANVFGVTCCCVCKVCIHYKRKMSGEKRSLGTKNMLDHLKWCLPAPASARNQSDSTSSASEIEGTYSSNSSSSSNNSKGSSGSTSSKAIQRLCFKTWDSYVIHSGKKVGEEPGKLFMRRLLLLLLLHTCLTGL